MKQIKACQGSPGGWRVCLCVSVDVSHQVASSALVLINLTKSEMTTFYQTLCHVTWRTSHPWWNAPMRVVSIYKICQRDVTLNCASLRGRAANEGNLTWIEEFIEAFIVQQSNKRRTRRILESFALCERSPCVTAVHLTGLPLKEREKCNSPFNLRVKQLLSHHWLHTDGGLLLVSVSASKWQKKGLKAHVGQDY